MTPYIICGFPGIGKSYLSENAEPYIVTDSDSSMFPKDNFPENYLTHIDKLLTGGLTDIVMCSTHKEVVSGLLSRGYDINIVMPSKDMKDTMINRYKQRNSPQSFIDLLSKNYMAFIDDLLVHKDNEHVNIVMLNNTDKCTLYDIIKYFSMVPFIRYKPDTF